MFDWFYRCITYPTAQVSRDQFEPFTIVKNRTAENDKKCVLWADSDISYLQQITDPVRVEKSMQCGIYFSNIGAKITEVV